MRGERLLATACAAVLAASCGPFGSRAAPHRPARPSPTSLAAQFTVDGKPVSGEVRIGARGHLRVVFSRQVPPSSVVVAVEGKPVAPDSLAWSPDLLSVEVPLATVAPYHAVPVAVTAPPRMINSGPLQVTPLATVPANAASGIQPGFRPQTPIEIVVENSGAARPQSGLQDADLVYEYLSEYSITRMTAIYFARIPEQIGPARSCRMVNAYLSPAYGGYAVCTGVSDGTGGWLIGTTPGSRALPVVIESSDKGNHFHRVGSRPAPHNDYVSGADAGRLRSEAPLPPADYAVDPPHADVVAGQLADAPSVPLHGVAYGYDPGSGQYLRSDHGAPFIDQLNGQQLRVKNVVLLHVPFHNAGWVEDENGGATSVWYDMLGSGPAEVFSDGHVVHATWHMGAQGQAHFDNHQPVWLTDEAGQVLLLNSGLTWLHVLGNGQERCPVSPSDCG